MDYRKTGNQETIQTVLEFNDPGKGYDPHIWNSLDMFHDLLDFMHKSYETIQTEGRQTDQLNYS